jgi:hypothetical protein
VKKEEKKTRSIKKQTEKGGKAIKNINTKRRKG